MTSGDSNTFRPDIEGLRAVAIALVLLYHAQIPFFPGGFIGVDVFFVISGYLITRSLLEESERNGRVRFARFYARRARRLLPASVLALSATALGTWLALPSSMWREFGTDIAAAAAYVVNWRFASRAVDYLAQDVLPSPVQHFWSLSIEEQFYFVWPALIGASLFLGLRLQARSRTVVAWVLSVCVIGPSLFWSITYSNADPAPAFFASTTRLWQLGIGALLAVVGGKLVIRTVTLHRLARAVFAAGILAPALLVDGSYAWPGYLAIVPVVATAGLIATREAARGDLLDRVLSSRPFQRVGAWSYSLYLWHWPPLAILGARWGGLTTSQAIVITCISFVPALAAYRFVESPLRRNAKLLNSDGLTLGLGAALTLVGIAAGVTLALATPFISSPPPAGAPFGAQTITGEEDRDALMGALADTTVFTPSPAAATADRPTLYDDGCQVRQADPEPLVCERGDPDGSLTMMVIGDSKVAQWEPALHELGVENGWRVLVITKSGCPLTTTMPTRMGGPYPECLEWSESVLEIVEETGADVVVVSQVARSGWNSVTSMTDQPQLIEGMLEAYERVAATGAEVVILRDNPHPGFTVPDCVAEHPTDLGKCVVDLDDVEDTGSWSVQQVVAERGGYPVVDMIDLICPARVCLPVIGGVLVYRDGSHITATYIRSMAEELGLRFKPIIDGR